MAGQRGQSLVGLGPSVGRLVGNFCLLHGISGSLELVLDH